MSLTIPPIVWVKFANYIRDGDGGPLLCAMHGMSYSPFDKFDKAYSPHVVDIDKGGKHLIPSRISIDLDLTPLHKLNPGWAADHMGVPGIKWWGGDKWGKVNPKTVYGKVGDKASTPNPGLDPDVAAAANAAYEADFDKRFPDDAGAGETPEAQKNANAAQVTSTPGTPD